MHISYKPLWHTLIERNMRKEDLRLAAGLTTSMIANMGKEGKHISMDTLARICETLDCGIMDVIELAGDEPSTTGGNNNGKTERKNHRERH
jgi:DNA-binding Xre family transcriptional regulator